MTLPPVSDIVFVAVAAVTLAGAFMAVWFKNVFYNALSLILCLFGIACLFIFLNSEFLAIIEVIIYIGAIAVAILFALMLSRPMLQKEEPRDIKKITRSLVLGVLLFAGLAKILGSAPWPAASPEGDYSIQGIGRMLLTSALLPFEAVSLVLLVAIIGALLITSARERKA